MPRTSSDLRDWVRERLTLTVAEESDLLEALEGILANQRQLVEESKHDAIRALTEGFTEKIAGLQQQLSDKDVRASTIARYFEDVVADLTEKSHRDPKTKLLNFNWFMERIESFLAVEQRVRWCGVGVVDISSFKRYNDTLGHAVGDRIIERVARILSDQIRSQDFLALDRGGQGGGTRDLHARFGGDEFSFFIPDLPGCVAASEIAGRFKAAVEGYDWSREDAGLAAHPVKVDVGVVCLNMGPLAERRGNARKLASELIHRADVLMYEAKSRRSTHVHSSSVCLDNGRLIELSEHISRYDEPPQR